jgi:hypothetical protein
MQLRDMPEVQKPNSDAYGTGREMNCESNGKPLCINGWQYRYLAGKVEKERVPCVLCRKDAHVSWAKNWKPKAGAEAGKPA